MQTQSAAAAQTPAAILIDQLGNMTFRMLGVSSLVALPNGLQFGIKGSKAANKLVITVDATSDTYDVQAWRVTRKACDLVTEQSGVYVDRLHQTIQSMTGLYTRI